MATKEKFEEAKRLYETANADQRYVLESLFPELRESEDERIRKMLIEFFSKGAEYNDSTNGISDKDVLAWLEKQGEQKPAWSEEDKEQLDFCCAAIEMSNFSNVDYRTQAVSWLNLLKDRVQPQPKQEWSEEDKRKIDRIYYILRQAADTHAFSTSCRLIGDKECIKLQDWLKSLSPKSQWKPSDEQMKTLEESIIFLGSSCVSISQFVLNSLYNDLQKLKG